MHLPLIYGAVLSGYRAGDPLDVIVGGAGSTSVSTVSTAAADCVATVFHATPD